MARPRAFDEQQVLQQAMQVFWEHGYSATTITQLKEATGLNPFSIYSTFGDKRGLFLRALTEHYGPATAAHVATITDTTESGSHAIAAFVDWCEGFATGDAFGRGCLMQNTLGEGTDDADFVACAAEGCRLLTNALRSAVRRGQSAGELDPALDPSEAASFLVAWNQGLLFMAKAAADRGPLRKATRQMHKILEGWGR